ncbi:MAG: hypothetical protein IJJ70_03625 [Treponema sp.]|nr:hypothetical protein [Treponema sp.]MBR0486782.1 hypothetical protein [Treponema sp.]
MESKSVILFIFEGVTEKIALENILKKIFSSNHVDVEFIGTDITSDNSITRYDVENELRNFIREKIKPLRIDLNDIQQIVHVIDTDGGFVDSNYIQYDANVDGIAYTQDLILSKNPANTLKRNKDKTEKVNFLKNKTYLKFKQENLEIQYQLYFFSRNREHALQNESRELFRNEKNDMAFDFAIQYQGHESDFITLVNDTSLKVPGTFLQTWSFIQKDNNSLHRHSNFHLLFKDVK